MRFPFDKAQLVCPFGPRHIFGKDEFHYGIDFVTSNKKIYACEAGRVIVARPNGGYGNNIMIQHEGLISVYGHLDQIMVKEGQMVKEGDWIGMEGSTGRSTGSHLHFEFRRNRSERSMETNPAKIIGFDEKRMEWYTYSPKKSPEKYQEILKARMDHPENWLKFIEKMKEHPMGKWLPELIEKISK